MGAILFYDGFCFLCSSTAKWIRRLDKQKQIQFLALQSKEAKSLLADHPIPKETDSIILLSNNSLLLKSDAVFSVLDILGGGWKILTIFKFLPLRWRDFVYDFIARNRYKWFGKKDICDLD